MRLFISVLVLMVTTSALAQSISADRFRFAIDREGFLDIQAGRIPAHLEYDVALFVGYALAPLVAFEEGRREDTRRGALVADRLDARLLASLALFEWFSLGIEVPYVLGQSGDEEVFGLGPNPVAAAGFGDVRLTPKVRLLTHLDFGFDLAVLLPLELPTSSPRGGFLGDEGFVFSPQLALSRDLPRLRVALNLGARLMEDKVLLATETGSALLFRVGAQYRLDEDGLPLGISIALSNEAAASPELFTADQTGTEALFGFDYTLFDRLVLIAGGGVGILGAPRVPEFRAFAAVRYAPRDYDRDDDGVSDTLDRCPGELEDIDGFEDRDGCPDLDNDNDGVPDATDRCPLEPEDIDGFEDEDGCPDPDNDGDKIPDANDGCPSVAEDIDEHEDEDGCPDLDNDGDKIPDAVDSCPDIAGDPREAGCPWVDEDNDNVSDARDECLDAPEDADGFKDEDGCPDPDNDGDRVPDVGDQCPDAAEDRDGFEDEDGCPDPDNDQDGVPDIDDGCPTEPEDKPGEGADGCPQK